MTHRIKELREKQAKIVSEARERLDKITAETDETRAKELESAHDKAMAEHDKIERDIARLEQVEALEKREASRRDQRRPNPGDGNESRESDGGEKLEYRHVFHKFIARGGDPSELSSEERQVLRAGYQKSVEERAQTVGTATAGGYTVPTELADQIIKTMKDWGPMYDDAVCTVLNTSSGNPIDLPTIDDTGKTVSKHAEGEAVDDTGAKDAVFGKKTLGAYVYDTDFIRFSLELAQDSIFNMEALLGSLLGERLARGANRELTIGDGVDDPEGIVTGSSQGKVAAATLALTGDELIDLLHSVNSAYRRSPKARWMFADTTLAVIRKLKDGQGNYLWQMGDVTKSQPGTLLGYQYSINDDVPTIAAGAKPVIFGDMSKYFVRKVGSPVIGVLKERFWPDLAIAGLIRFDGKLGDQAAIKHLKMAAA